MEQFSLEYPSVLLIVLLFVICAIWCKAKNRAIYFPHISALKIDKYHSSVWMLFLKWLGIVSAIIALSSPVQTTIGGDDYRNGKDIILILDASESMQEGAGSTLVNSSKFDVARKALDRFVENRKDDRIGLVTFGDAAFVASPLTFDKELLRTMIGMQQVGIAGARTAINDAVAQSYGVLSRSKSKSKVVILLTDGMENQSIVEQDELISLVSKLDIKLYTIGFGDGYDASYLKLLSKACHGESFEARDEQSLQKIYDYIDKLESSKIKANPKIYKDYLFVYPLFIAWLSLILYTYFRNQRES